jgi:hypothetical protein
LRWLSHQLTRSHCDERLSFSMGSFSSSRSCGGFPCNADDQIAHAEERLAVHARLDPVDLASQIAYQPEEDAR